MNQNLENEGRDIVIKYLLDSDYLQTDEEKGCAKKMFDVGYDSLSDKQKKVFDNFIIAKHVSKECYNCLDSLSWHEILENIQENIKTNKFICSGCLKKREN